MTGHASAPRASRLLLPSAGRLLSFGFVADLRLLLGGPIDDARFTGPFELHLRARALILHLGRVVRSTLHLHARGTPLLLNMDLWWRYIH
ncbi:hypothetical protein ASG57_15545 [Bradyrhizobium sp. Leaf396]|nr:hypothetical protein ASG57_15545 [Bradyrhizobium sp. Leaf396]